MDNTNKNFRLFLCGDVMTGRGLDQALPFPSQPQLYESFIQDARDYLFLAETANGKIPYPVSMNYIWGDALLAWQEFKPDIKIINLETAITQSPDYWPNKGINYRMSPDNIGVLACVNIDICALGNNHTVDWGYKGLEETLATLQKATIQFAGAGNTLAQAMQPAIFTLENEKRALVFSIGTDSSGVPSAWAADADRPGLYYIPDLSDQSLSVIVNTIQLYKQAGDLIILSIHWGSNWGYDIPESFRLFAHNLIDLAQVDVIFGHSSHHPRGIEIYKNKPILYGCGDFINDYEGISGHEAYRGDLSIMYFLDFDKTSLEFKKLILVPLEIKNFTLHFASKKDSQWLLATLKTYSSWTTQFEETNSNLPGMTCFTLW